ncbi:hypothetical protein [Cellvibrio japonicus]|uniref:Uncharacterized protein n=1 Tax=Cellvibrio japonicus (strain Ueda107) TaxID=498211 RepID=B3PH66_CELJU|nr:hypothetical protein [Cellvibrio japonicus]ACE83991.1 hypothetical protein CJA_0263 [Cellvibrio japonicus Ueda107]
MEINERKVSGEKSEAMIASEIVGRLLAEQELDAIQGAGCSFLQGRGFSNTASTFC